MVQGNITGKQKQVKNNFETIVDRYNTLTKQALEKKPDFIIWPESVFTRSYDGTLESLEKFILEDYPSLIMGVVIWENGVVTNSAIMVKNRIQEQRYDKKHLLIFGEYVPFEKIFPFLRKLTLLHKSEKSGTRSSIFTFGNVKANISICFEDIFPDEIRLKNIEGSNLMINISNDSWFGKGLGPVHHSVNARLRGIENRRSFFRCTATGVTTASDLTGKIVSEGRVGLAENVSAKLPLYEKRTIYSYIGEIFSYTCLGITIFAIIFMIISNLRKVKE